MKNKKHVAAIVAVAQYFETLAEAPKLTWADRRSAGWQNQSRPNWTKQ
jgi:hypothetical protein